MTQTSELGGKADQPALTSVSANAFSVIGGSSDFLIALGRTAVAQNQDGHLSPFTEWYLSVTISPLAAKQLSQMLTNCVAEFEAAMGPIKIPTPTADAG
jgi:hypothetical protein